jgi:hypothetical protein
MAGHMAITTSNITDDSVALSLMWGEEDIRYLFSLPRSSSGVLDN